MFGSATEDTVVCPYLLLFEVRISCSAVVGLQQSLDVVVAVGIAFLVTWLRRKGRTCTWSISAVQALSRNCHLRQPYYS